MERKSLISYQGAKNDIDEKLTNDISSCFKQTTASDGTVVYTPTNTQGEISLSLINKKKHNYMFQVLYIYINKVRSYTQHKMCPPPILGGGVSRHFQ